MLIDLDNIRNIIFDLGNVLLNLDFDRSIKAFNKLGLKQDVIDNMHIHADPVFYELSIGKVSPASFRDRIRKLLQNIKISDQEIDSAWSAMILDVPVQRVEMLLQLKAKYKIYLFSNTNSIHINKISQEFYDQYQFEFSSLFEKVYYSHEIHKYKPDVTSYLKVIELAGINPTESLFIDDLEPNIAGAEKAGLKTFWLKDGMEITTVLKPVISEL